MSDDTISRQVVDDYIVKLLSGYLYDEERTRLEELSTYLWELPSVNPQEPKTGHWYRVSMDKYVQHAMAYYRCSECGKDIIGEHNYCPNCGCRMVEPQERSE